MCSSQGQPGADPACSIANCVLAWQLLSGTKAQRQNQSSWQNRRAVSTHSQVVVEVFDADGAFRALQKHDEQQARRRHEAAPAQQLPQRADAKAAELLAPRLVRLVAGAALAQAALRLRY